MALSVLDLFSVGIGPSSSHTVGPMRAAKLFADGLKGDGHLSSTRRVQAELFGSLGATGRGHGSDKAVVLGFKGLDPETVDTSTADDQVAAAALGAELWVGGDHRVDFNWDEDVVLHRRKSLPAHPNGMTFRALDHAGSVLSERSFYSVGGGFVVDGDADAGDRVVADATVLPYPFNTADELLETCSREGMSISDVKFVPGADDDGVVRFLLAAAAVGILFKINASVSGAEVGCQGEVGSACSMAAAGLCEVLGGTPAQVENAAEVGIEHNLGLTCDPVGGLVQIPCIERNAIASVKAINAARLCLHGDGSHRVSLDKAIKTMRDTGADMKTKYKETSRGGLAVNVIEC